MMKRSPGRPREHPTARDRVEAYRRRVGAAGFVRVNVIVPASRAGDIRAIAAGMRESARRGRSTAAAPITRPERANAGRPWSTADDAAAVRMWRDGAGARELTSGLGRDVDEILSRLVALEELGSVREGRAELGARGRLAP